jgi:hypothetical protein
MRFAMNQISTADHNRRLLFALAVAAGLGLGLALVALFDAWYSGTGFNGAQFIGAH